ncbi:MAG: peptide protein [Flavisolibacter sp.]|jgi:uncharacterized protein (DUF2147 family)|nr:peptide protein [Flavisolibacter sp.]
MKQFKYIVSLLTVLSVLNPNLFAQQKQAAGDEIVGVYWSPKKNAKISIYKSGEHYFGRSIWIASPRKDTENSKSSLRARDVLGIELLTHFSYNNGTYTNGEVYDPENGKTYDCKMSLNGDKLKVRGYIGFALFGRTEIFERVK